MLNAVLVSLWVIEPTFAALFFAITSRYVVSKYGGYLKYERERGKSALNIFLPMVKERSANY